jgi:hypothetical protein
MLAKVTHISPITTVRRKRVLPVSGQVIVLKGQKVNATDTIAEANLYPKHVMFNIARGLKVSEDLSDQYIKYEVGERIVKGDVIAGPAGFIQRAIRSPYTGRIVLASQGHVMVEVENPPFEMKAGISGEVLELIPDRGIVVETTGALIQAVWGNEKINQGSLVLRSDAPDQVLTVKHLDKNLREKIVVSGYCDNERVLKKAARLQISGLILSSMTPSLIPLAGEIQVPIVLTDGFGRIPMNLLAFELLSTNENRDASINSEFSDRNSGTRPEIVIPLDSSEDVPELQDVAFFSPGKRVRIVSSPHTGEIGTLQKLNGLVEMPNGLKMEAAEICFDSGETVVIPLENLEVIT